MVENRDMAVGAFFASLTWMCISIIYFIGKEHSIFLIINLVLILPNLAGAVVLTHADVKYYEERPIQRQILVISLFYLAFLVPGLGFIIAAMYFAMSFYEPQDWCVRICITVVLMAIFYILLYPKNLQLYFIDVFFNPSRDVINNTIAYTIFFLIFIFYYYIISETKYKDFVHVARKRPTILLWLINFSALAVSFFIIQLPEIAIIYLAIAPMILILILKKEGVGPVKLSKGAVEKFELARKKIKNNEDKEVEAFIVIGQAMNELIRAKYIFVRIRNDKHVKNCEENIKDIQAFIGSEIEKPFRDTRDTRDARISRVSRDISDLKTVNQLIQALNDEDFWIRYNVSRRLLKMGDVAVGPLIETLKSENNYVREASVETLKQIEKIERNEINSLIRLLKIKDWYLRRNIIGILGELKVEKSVNILSKFLERSHFRDRLVAEAAAEALRKIGKIGLEALIRVFKEHGGFYVKGAALRAIGKTDDEIAVETCIQALKNNDGGIRIIAAEILGEKRNNKAIKPLIERLRDPYVKVQEKAIEALNAIGDPAVDSLAEVLDSKKIKLRQNAARTLAIIGNPKAIDPLIQALKVEKDETVRKYMKWALEKIEEKRSLH